MEKDPALIRYYSNLCSTDGEPGNLIRVFASKDNTFLVLGTKAPVVATDYVKTSTVVKQWGSPGNPLPVVPFNEAVFRELISDALLNQSTSIELHERQSGTSTWSLAKRATPGNLQAFESVVLADGVTANAATASVSSIAAVVIKEESTGYSVGCGFCNTTLRVMGLAEFTDNLQLTNLDAFLTQVGAREVVFPSDTKHSAAYEAADKVVARCGVASTRAPVKDFTAHDVQRKLSILLRNSEAVLEVLPLAQACSAAMGAVNQLQLLDDSSNNAQYKLIHVNANTHMKINAAAVRALNLIGSNGIKRSGAQSIADVIGKHITTAMGERKLMQMILQPLTDVDKIEERYDMTEVFVEDAILREGIKHDVLRQCGDLDRLTKKLQRGKASLKDAASLQGYIDGIPVLIQYLQSYDGKHKAELDAAFTCPIREMHQCFGNLKKLIEATLDTSDSYNVVFNPEFDDNLMELSKQRKEVSAAMNADYKSTLVALGVSDKILKLEQHTTYGHVYRVTRKEDKLVRESKKCTVINTCSSGVRFTTSGLSSANDAYKKIMAEYNVRQRDLAHKMLETVASYLPVLDDAKECLAALDVYASWATMVTQSSLPMTRPTLSSSAAEAKVQFTGLRHGLVEAQGSAYVPNDVMQQDNDSNLLIITGPNMGGKSTYMRSVGVGVVLAQIGCYIPCEQAHVSVRDAIYCRVGASDFMFHGVSTFMVEMLETAAILSSATERSLVIIDELGRGTSTYDGFGLAWGIARRLAETTKCFTLFATHFHELTALAEQAVGVKNVHVAAAVDNGRLTFKYNVAPGACEKSFGICVARMASFPEHVVATAEEKAAELEGTSCGVQSKKRMRDDNNGACAKLIDYAARIRRGLPDEERHRLAEIIRNDEVVRPVIE